MFGLKQEPHFLPPIPQQQEMQELDLQWTNTLSSVHQLIHKSERVLGCLHDNSAAIGQALEALQQAHADFADIATLYNLEQKA